MSNSLTKQINQLLVSHTFFRFGRSAFDIFLSVLIWRLTGDLKTVAVFNIVYILTHTSMFIVLIPLVNKGLVNLIKRLALFGFCLVYFLLAWMGERVADHIFLFATIIGIVNGSYWFPYQVQRFDITHIKNRGNYTGIETAVTTFVKLAAPVVGGLIISLSGIGLGGYQWLFAGAAVLFILALVLGDSEQIKTEKVKSLTKTFAQIKKMPQIIKVFLAGTMSGFGLGNGALVTVLVPLLIFDQNKLELEMGGWLSAFALMSILTSLVVGKVVNYRRYDATLILGGAFLAVAFILLLIFPAYWSMLIFGAAQGISFSMMSVPYRVYSENLLHKLDGYHENKVSYFVIRELFNIGLGMTASFVLLYFLSGVTVASASWLAGLVLLATLLQVWLLISVKYAKEELRE